MSWYHHVIIDIEKSICGDSPSMDGALRTSNFYSARGERRSGVVIVYQGGGGSLQVLSYASPFICKSMHSVHHTHKSPAITCRACSGAGSVLSAWRKVPVFNKGFAITCRGASTKVKRASGTRCGQRALCLQCGKGCATSRLYCRTRCRAGIGCAVVRGTPAFAQPFAGRLQRGVAIAALCGQRKRCGV
jgi:hypothetical protein